MNLAKPSLNFLKEKKNLFLKWLEENKRNLIEIIQFNNRNIIKLDLSINNPNLKGINPEDIVVFKKVIQQFLKEGNAQIGVGGYLEKRPFYTAPEYALETPTGTEWRNVHLGIDIWTPPNEPVYCPLDATVFSFKYNEGRGNYGPTIILKHEVNEELTFYTLYGHLTLNSLENLELDQTIKAGVTFAKIGNSPINGNWPPHLHFQIMLDMLDYTDDFRGVTFPSELDYWGTICPDPAPFFDNVIETF